MAPTSPYPSLFSPLTLHGATLRNRIVHASMTTKLGLGQRVTEGLLNYHRNRAAGGAGMIVTEPLAVQPWHREGYKVDVFADAQGLQRWASAVEGQGCRLLGQLQDSGRGRHEDGAHPHAVGPSALPDDLSWTVARALTGAEIEALIERFAQAAVLLKQAGFSGVEISAAHGHLFHQFLSPWSNRRDDEWGGAVANRTRLVRRLARAIRDLCGDGFVIGIKLPGDDGNPDSIDADQAAKITAALADPAVVSYFCHAQGSHSRSLDQHLPDMHGPRAPFVELIQGLGHSAGKVPLMAVGLITDPAEAERIVADDTAALVGLGRALVTDPAWPNKAAAGRAAEIRYCVSCNTCWASIVRDGGPIACDNNPRVGLADEADWWPNPVRSKRRIVVVGSGVAGLEASWIAAARGHAVTLLSKRAQLGGETWLQAQLPGGENLSSVYDYQQQAGTRAGLEIETVAAVDAQSVAGLQPDCVVLATGSRMLWPSTLPATLGDDGVVTDLRETMRGLIDHRSPVGGTAVIYDHDHTLGTYQAAERLAELFDRVVMLTPRETVAQQESLVTRQRIYRQLNLRGVEIVPFTELGDFAALEDGVVAARNVYTGAQTPIDEVALLTFATPRVPNDELAAPLRAAGIEIYRVGDCAAPGSLLAATRDGHRIGNEI